MFERFVLNKIESENAILKKLVESIPAEKNLTKINILNSNLSDFTKNYLVFEFSDKTDAEELTSKISKSNKLYFNYTVRPKWTLQTFLFNNFESRPPNEIIKKLNLFTFYSFYTDAVKDFITDNSQIFITKNEVTSIINQTNEAIYEKLLNEINNAKIKNFFLQLFLLKYETESNFNLESTVPYSFIKIFLEDKSFSKLEKKFNSLKGLSGETEVSLKDIIKILNDKYNLQEKTVLIDKTNGTKKNIFNPPEGKDFKKTIEVKKEELKEDEIKISDVTNIDLKKVEKKEEEIDIPDIKKDDIIIEDVKQQKLSAKLYSEQLINADINVKETENIENRTTFISVTDDKLKSLFNDKQLEKILNKVYKSDLIYREKSFDKLKAYKTWDEASSHLKDIFKSNNVDIYNKDVVSFINILNDYYQNKE